MRRAMASPWRAASTDVLASPVWARLMSHSDVKRTQCAGRDQNSQLMRGGRA